MFSSNFGHVSWSSWHHRLHQKLKKNPKLLPPKSSLLLSISGGQDSMVMLKLILDLKRLHNWNLSIWHGDHGWHEESEKIANELKEWCEKRNLHFQMDKVTKKEVNSEVLARDWRYKSLRKRAEQLSAINQANPCRHVLTAHTGSDRAETFILNVARGTDLAGLSSLNDSRTIDKSLEGKIQLVRPLLCFSRSETEKICKEMMLPVWTDPTNENKKYSRNRIRLEVLSVLEDLYPGCSLRIASLSERLKNHKEDKLAISMLAVTSLKSSEGYCRESLSKLPLTARTTLLASLLQKEGLPTLSANQLEEISISIETGKPPGSRDLSKGWKIKWVKETIKIEHPN